MRYKTSLPTTFLVIIFFSSTISHAQQLPVWNSLKLQPVSGDWLIQHVIGKAEVFTSENGRNLILYNGLLKREFRLRPNVTCFSFLNMKNNQQLIRAVREEARVIINGKSYNIGGMKGEKQKAYVLPEWIHQYQEGTEDFKYESVSVSPIIPQLKWQSKFWASKTENGVGKQLSFKYRSLNKDLAGLIIRVNYELYDNLPLVVKYLTIENVSKHTFKIDSVVNEVMAIVEEESAVEGTFDSFKTPQGIYFETNYAYNNSMRYKQSDQTTHWKPDSTYKTQVHYRYLTPALLEIYPEHAPGIQLKPGEKFHSIRTHELLMDGDDRERRGLAIRKMYRTVAPWTSANPIFMHLVSENDDQVRKAIDQCAEVGYEALIISFGSHLNMEDTTINNITNWKEMAAYAHSKNVKIGCYSLFSSRKISLQDDIVDPKTGKVGGAFFGNAPCFGSKWGLWYRDTIKNFFQKTDFDIWENDGPYPGDICGSTSHPGHENADDSQWRQMNIQKELYHWLNERGIYINCPDWYFLDGTNKIALGYRETNFKLPRSEQKILNRQNIFDGTWEKTPSMNWGFVPLTEYGGGGPAATIEPLVEHLDDYEQLMMQYYGAGIQACYRGPRLYDTEKTKLLVRNVVNWYKKYREILNSDVIHLRRADGRDWDGLLHVNPRLKEKGLMMLYNPLKQNIKRRIQIPLYFTGLTKTAKIREKDGKYKSYKLNRDFTIDFVFTLPAEGYSWFVIE